ncbi:putative serine incorporator [Phytophthora citrophthora]|uniref:Serine incorporator n=1 Tax=Phytophthora citrophthora TaxID=4793 RepID=A0AAD9LQD2_9STRA|nr:putative serine incorporator [Phytophthora citrophthora]
MSAAFRIEINWIRGVYIALFFCNAIFATLFKTIGRGEAPSEVVLGNLLSSFGTFSDCDTVDSEHCQGNQVIFRASFSISTFFLIRALLSRFGWVQPRRRAMPVLVWVEIPVFVALLVGSFYMPTSFFNGYVAFARVASGCFILFQIFSIVSASCKAGFASFGKPEKLTYILTRDFIDQLQDTLLHALENAEKAEADGNRTKMLCIRSAYLWKIAYLGICAYSLVAVGSGIAYLYMQFGDCSLGLAFTTITIITVGLLTIICSKNAWVVAFQRVLTTFCLHLVSSWMEVGLLPPCVISAYLVLMCWQALVSNPDKTCEHRDHPPPAQEDEEAANTNSMIANAVIGAFAMTWTSWRTSSAAVKLLVVRSGRTPRGNIATRPVHDSNFADVAVDLHPPQNTTCSKSEAVTPARITVEVPRRTRELAPERWQFYSMMCLAGLYMAMVLTDWDSAEGSSNDVSMWVKIIAQWLTILLFSWTLAAPKLFPDRDFS